MKNKTLSTFVFLLIINLSAGYAQNIMCRGTIVDADTNLPLREVSIYKERDINTVLLKSNNAGEFQISIQTGSRLLLKKSGYVWQIVRADNNNPQHIELVPSNPENSEIILRDADEKRREGETNLYFNGQLVPETERTDALGIDKKEIKNIDVRIENGKQAFIIDTY